MGHYFLDILYDIKSLLSKFNVPAPNTDGSGPATLPKKKGGSEREGKIWVMIDWLENAEKGQRRSFFPQWYFPCNFPVSP